MKTRETRRQFIRKTSVGLAGIATWPSWPAPAQSDGPNAIPEPNTTGRPLPEPKVVPGLHAYSPEKSVAAGETIAFHVSSTVPYDFSICRLGTRVDDPDGDQVLYQLPKRANRGGPQPIHAGSFVHIQQALDQPLRALTLECWVRPWSIDARAGLISQFNAPNQCGFGLFLTPKGGAGLYLGNGKKYDPDLAKESNAGLLKKKEWHHVAATWDGTEAALWINSRQVGLWKLPSLRGVVNPGSSALRLAASGRQGWAVELLDGDLAMPTLYGRALAASELQQRFQQKGLHPPASRFLLAFWPLREERGSTVADISENHQHGLVVNRATWMIGGPSFNANVTRFGGYEPLKDLQRGHGLRFASDDLYDCDWQVTHKFKVPKDAKPGLYVGRFQYQLEGQPLLYHATFIVRKPSRRRKAPILVLCASNTWLAYNGTAFGQTSKQLKTVFGTDGTKNSTGDPPAFNFYRAHRAGQGTYQLGFRMPWPAAGPYVLYGGPTDYSHLMRADRFAQVWLEQAGYRFDVISDLDLHRDPDQLQGYPVFVINGHSEYWSLNMMRGLEHYLARRGNVVCLSGNSLFWRVSYNQDGSILECRKVDAPGNQMTPEQRGECWHSEDGLRGGMLRECGYPGWKLVGLDSLGWNNPGNPDQFGAYRVERPDHFLFQKPFPVEVTVGAMIGQGPGGALPRANGHEIDVRPSTLKALQEKSSPTGTSVPDDPQGMVRLANGIITWKIGGAAFDYFFRPIKPPTDQGGEMIYWERTDGGRVFNAGSIGSGWALQADPQFQRLLKNVLAHFGVPQQT